jgi:hypothetical protein
MNGKYLKGLITTAAILMTLLMGSCSDTTSPGQAAVIQINRLLDDLEDAVREYDIEKVSEHLHYDFLHNGKEKDDLIFIWYQRLLSFDHLSLSEREIKVTGFLARASFRMTFSSADSTLVTEEPSEQFGDVSFFIRDEGKWHLFGNQR